MVRTGQSFQVDLYWAYHQAAGGAVCPDCRRSSTAASSANRSAQSRALRMSENVRTSSACPAGADCVEKVSGNTWRELGPPERRNSISPPAKFPADGGRTAINGEQHSPLIAGLTSISIRSDFFNTIRHKQSLAHCQKADVDTRLIRRFNPDQPRPVTSAYADFHPCSISKWACRSRLPVTAGRPSVKLHRS